MTLCQGELPPRPWLPARGRRQDADQVVRAVDLGVAPAPELPPVVDGGDPPVGANVLGPVRLALKTLDLDDEMDVRRPAIGSAQIDDEVRDEVVVASLVLIRDREVESSVLDPGMDAF